MPTPDTAALAARLLGMYEDALECRLIDGTLVHYAIHTHDTKPLKAAADALAALSGNPTPQTTSGDSTDNAPGVQPPAYTLTVSATEHTTAHILPPHDPRDPVVSVVTSESGWTASIANEPGIIGVGDTAMDALADLCRALSAAIPDNPTPAPSVAEARDNLLNEAHAIATEVDGRNDGPTSFDVATRLIPRTDALIAAVRADVPKDVREAAVAVNDVATDMERQGLELFVTVYGNALRRKHLRALARHGGAQPA